MAPPQDHQAYKPNKASTNMVSFVETTFNFLPKPNLFENICEVMKQDILKQFPCQWPVLKVKLQHVIPYIHTQEYVNLLSYG